MLWFLAFHIIALVCWFAGLFYLPRLFVYHSSSQDTLSNERFKIMERRLYYGITTPAAILTTLLGIILLSSNFTYYFATGWMPTKLILVFVLWVYHVCLGIMVHQFKQNKNRCSENFYRFFNEIPTILLIAIVILAIVKPF